MAKDTGVILQLMTSKFLLEFALTGVKVKLFSTFSFGLDEASGLRLLDVLHFDRHR